MIHTMIYIMIIIMVYTMVYLCYKYLGILSSKMMSWKIKCIAMSLWPAPVIFTFPLKSHPCPQMSPICVWHKDCCKDGLAAAQPRVVRPSTDEYLDHVTYG